MAKQKWITEDGSEFDTKKQAETYEKEQEQFKAQQVLDSEELKVVLKKTADLIGVFQEKYEYNNNCQVNSSLFDAKELLSDLSDNTYGELLEEYYSSY